MQQLRKGDTEMVGHARRELEIAGLFTPSEDGAYDGFIGKGVLAMVKLFDSWTQNDPAKMSTIKNVFDFVIAGDLLSPPSDDPDEWEEYNVEGHTGLRNKRNPMFITQDDRKTWRNLRTGQKGIVNDHKTGKPLEGVEDPNGHEPEANDQESAANAGDAGHGENAVGPAEEPAVESEKSTSGSQGVEAAELDAGVEPEGSKDQGEKKAPAKKSKKREA